MKFWILLFLLSVLSAPHAFADEGHAQDQERERSALPTDGDEKPNDREVITILLSHHHEVPSRADLEARTTDAREIVFALARDEEVFLFHRHRALRALTHWPDAEVYSFLHELLVDEDTEDGLRHHLLPILANGFGEDALDDLSPFLLDANDPQIRISAAGAIARISGDSARQTLMSALETEKHPLVQSRIERAAQRVR